MKKILIALLFSLLIPALNVSAEGIKISPISNGSVDNGEYSAVLGDGNLHTVYVVGGNIKYRYNLNNEESVAAGSSPSLSFNPITHQPAISYIAGGAVNYAWREASGAWQSYRLSAGNAASLAIDSAGISHIAYLEAEADGDVLNEVFYTSGYGQTFASSTLLANGAYCNDQSCRVSDNYLKPEIRVDAGNKYHVVVFEQYRNDTLAPDHQDYLYYLGLGVNGQGTAKSEGGINLSQNFLSLDNSGQPISVWARGSEINTSTINPTTLAWIDQNLSIEGITPSLYATPSLKVIAYGNGGQIEYREAAASEWGVAINVATGTKPLILADDYRYIYYLDNGQLYLAATRDIPDLSAPTASFISKPENSTTETSARLTVGGNDVFAYKYKLDNGTFGEEKLISAPITLSDLSVGAHTISVIGRDGSLNWQSESSATNYTWTINAPTGGGGGGGSGGGGSTSLPTASSTPIVSLSASSTPVILGRVLGASAFRFTRILRPGMSGVDVQELQKILQAEGFFKVKTTKYFGPATKKSLVLWQKKNKIRPATGVVGKPTLKFLNSL